MTAETNGKPFNYADLATFEGRIWAWCEWFDQPKPSLKYEDGGVLLTDELARWMKESLASLDWLLSGDPREMAKPFYQARQELKPFLDALSKFSGAEQKKVVNILLAHATGEIDYDAAKNRMQAEVFDLQPKAEAKSA